MTAQTGTYAPTPNQPNAWVVDSSIRTISNLIVDQSPSNPAAVEKALDLMGFEGDRAPILSAIAAAETYRLSPKSEADLTILQNAVALHGIEMAGVDIVLPNVSPDEGLSASFNSWFTLFGQFFDHGLDLVAKGQSGTVLIPLQPDDPLFDPASATNFMVLTRATVDAEGNTQNITTPFVDQNQTYTSHPSHQVFLREYRMTDDGPVATGKALDGVNGGLPTWAEVKAQAREMLGIDLTDFHVGNLPLLLTDPYGNFIPDPTTASRRSSCCPSRSHRTLELGSRHRASGWQRSHPAFARGSIDRGAFRRPHRPRVPRRHRPHRRAGRQDRGRRHRDRPGQRAGRPDRRLPTTTSCSTRTSSPATAAATRTSA